MKALMYTDIGKLEIQEIEAPKGVYVVKVLGCGICGTDLKTFNVGHHFFKPPTILGHEFVGELVAVPSSSPFIIGEHVVVAPYFECGACHLCTTGLPQMCKNKHFVSSGAFCEYVAIPKDYQEGMIRLPDGLDESVFTLVEPLACVLNGIAHLNIKPWSKALVVGGGPMGILFALYFQDIGVPVTVVEPNTYRKQSIQSWGIECIDPAESDPAQYDRVIICVNKASLIADAVHRIANGGTVLAFSGLRRGDVFEADAYSIHYREVSISGCSGFALEHFRKAFTMIQENPQHYSKLITHHMPLEEGLAAFQLLAEGKAFKIVLQP
ncbi:MAG: zinc-dependent alcohol dehydrogenase [Sphaerochaetaceae bacterium]